MAHQTPWSDRVSSRVRKTIKESGLSDHKLSERSNIPLSTFRRRVKGVNPWDTVQLERLAKALDISVCDLIPSCDHQEAKAS